MRWILAAMLAISATTSGMSWHTGRQTLERLTEATVATMPDELVDEWTAALGTGTRRVRVVSHRRDGENDADFAARHEALVQARAAAAKPIN